MFYKHCEPGVFVQWLGFDRFDRNQGIDSGRFPEFTAGLRAAMLGEAEAFFERIDREDRPVDERLDAGSLSAEVLLEPLRRRPPPGRRDAHPARREGRGRSGDWPGAGRPRPRRRLPACLPPRCLPEEPHGGPSLPVR
ncbi:DUF1592 domain-containing protein [Tautonia sociabilis]|uniref:DUF1592 domain-containing protein n=1 Tax=Tautonia sociabilis TaxID=2080755 RepID=A0A432MEV5_9BACT|nr:DUF1592 domain-containing protein [Tautonia sociabilis]